LGRRFFLAFDVPGPTVGASLLAMAFFQALGFFGLGYIAVAAVTAA
jgi:energy-converting hydrogenase Eha subunit E